MPTEPVYLLVSVPIGRLDTRVGEELAEALAAESVATALRASPDPAVGAATVEPFGYAHVVRFQAELGLPVECGLPFPARVFADGSWAYPADGEPLAEGDSLNALIEFARRAGGGSDR